jgi:hypothetical protein
MGNGGGNGWKNEWSSHNSQNGECFCGEAENEEIMIKDGGGGCCAGPSDDEK